MRLSTNLYCQSMTVARRYEEGFGSVPVVSSDSPVAGTQLFWFMYLISLQFDYYEFIV
jgi:hypothetical protein